MRGGGNTHRAARNPVDPVDSRCTAVREPDASDECRNPRSGRPDWPDATIDGPRTTARVTHLRGLEVPRDRGSPRSSVRGSPSHPVDQAGEAPSLARSRHRCGRTRHQVREPACNRDDARARRSTLPAIGEAPRASAASPGLPGPRVSAPIRQTAPGRGSPVSTSEGASPAPRRRPGLRNARPPRRRQGKRGGTELSAAHANTRGRQRPSSARRLETSGRGGGPLRG